MGQDLELNAHVAVDTHFSPHSALCELVPFIADNAVAHQLGRCWLGSFSLLTDEGCLVAAAPVVPLLLIELESSAVLVFPVVGLPIGPVLVANDRCSVSPDPSAFMLDIVGTEPQGPSVLGKSADLVDLPLVPDGSKVHTQSSAVGLRLMPV